MSSSEATNSSGHGVVVACQREDGRWLLIRRSTHVPAPMRVCFPGGWVDRGESLYDAAEREMREELGVAITPRRCVWHRRFTERPLVLWGILADLRSTRITPNALEVHEVLWLTAVEAAQHPDVLPHTDALIAALQQAVNRG